MGSSLSIQNRPVASSREVARYLHCTADNVSILCRNKQLEAVRLPTGWFVFIDSVHRFVTDRAERKREHAEAIRTLRLKERALGRILPA